MKIIVLLLCFPIVFASDGEVITNRIGGSDNELDGDVSTGLNTLEFLFSTSTTTPAPSSEAALLPPTASFDQEEYTIEQNVPFDLVCEISGNPTPNVYFVQLGEESFGPNVEQNENTLRFLNPQPNNRGIYECLAESNGQMAKASTIVDFIVHNPIEISLFESQVVQVGDYVLLKCQTNAGYPTPILKWTRSNPELLSDRVTEISEGTILISNITVAEAGEYVCHASNEFENITGSTMISVFQQPSLGINIFPNLPEMSLVEGDKLHLFCTSDDTSNIMWYKRDNMDQVQNIKAIKSIEKPSSAYIKYNVTQNDEGTYICRVSKKYRKLEKEIKILVKPKQNAEHENVLSVIDKCAKHGPCDNDGICESNGNDVECKCPIHYSGDHCQQYTQTIYFSHYKGNSYIELSRSSVVGSPFQYAISFGMVFRTTESNGLLIWYGQDSDEAYDDQDFMALAVVDGYLEFSVQLDGPPTTIKSDKRVDDGEIHQVAIKRDDKEATLQVGWSNISNKTIESRRNFSYLPGNVFIGGAPDIKQFTSYRYKQGFKGCIHVIQSVRDLTLQDVDIQDSLLSGYNVGSCSLFN